MPYQIQNIFNQGHGKKVPPCLIIQWVIVSTKSLATIFFIGKVTLQTYFNAFLYIFSKFAKACICQLTSTSSQQDKSSRSHTAGRQSLGLYKMFFYRTLPQLPFVPCKHLLKFLHKIPQLFLLFFTPRLIQSYHVLDSGPPIISFNQIIKYLNRIQMYIGFNILSQYQLHLGIFFYNCIFYPISIIIIFI